MRRLLTAIILAVLVFASPSTTGLHALVQSQPKMIAHFIEMGQADSTLLEFPCGAILIDAGSQDNAHTIALLDYLTAFFKRRTDLNNTLAAVFITHNHIDHTQALRTVAEHFTITTYFDNGQLEGRGTENPKWLRSFAESHAIKVREIADDLIPSSPYQDGLTDDEIDPLHCPTCDPKIHLLSGRLDHNSDWSAKEFSNKNNHSIAIRVDFGSSSFLFTGDMEQPAQERLITNYSGTHTLDVDVYHVGHHGSHNGTTAGLMQAVTPKLAVISMGTWDFGKDPFVKFSTYQYGHPRRTCVTLLASTIPGTRASNKSVMVADAVATFTPYTVKKRIYGTGWDGTVDVTATLAGTYSVKTGH